MLQVLLLLFSLDAELLLLLGTWRIRFYSYDHDPFGSDSKPSVSASAAEAGSEVIKSSTPTHRQSTWALPRQALVQMMKISHELLHPAHNSEDC